MQIYPISHNDFLNFDSNFLIVVQDAKIHALLV